MSCYNQLDDIVVWNDYIITYKINDFVGLGPIDYYSDIISCLKDNFLNSITLIITFCIKRLDSL